jgi:hypothetical protein
MRNFLSLYALSSRDVHYSHFPILHPLERTVLAACFYSGAAVGFASVLSLALVIGGL